MFVLPPKMICSNEVTGLNTKTNKPIYIRLVFKYFHMYKYFMHFSLSIRSKYIRFCQGLCVCCFLFKEITNLHYQTWKITTATVNGHFLENIKILQKGWQLLFSQKFCLPSQTFYSPSYRMQKRSKNIHNPQTDQL